jgi:hypothetical protein
LTPAAGNDYYVNSTVGETFRTQVAIFFNDWAKRRLLFKTQKRNIDLFGWGFHIIAITQMSGYLIGTLVINKMAVLVDTHYSIAINIQ